MYIFGYGSIINTHTRENESSGDIPVRVNGYCRDWNARVEQDRATALGIVREAGARCNGVLLAVSPALLAELDVREQRAGYQRLELAPSDVEPLSGGTLVDESICAYAPIAPAPATRAYPIEQTYLDTVLFGCFLYGESFLREFIRTTRSWAYPILQDREDPNYPRWQPSFVHPEAEEIFREETSSPSPVLL